MGVASEASNCSMCSMDASCVERDGNATCQCRPGFRGDGLNCTDVDECSDESEEDGPCDEYAECENLVGSYRCQCPKGWAGDGFTCSKAQSACLERSDTHLAQYKCRVGEEERGIEWRQHYFFDHESMKCSLVWYGDARCRAGAEGGKGGEGKSSLNIFSDMATCEEICERSGVLRRSGWFWGLWWDHPLMDINF